MSDFDPTDLRGQERVKADKARRERAERESEESDLKWLLGSRRGRRIVWRQLDRAGVFRISFSTNAMSMAFAEGNRNEGLRTIAMIHAHCPELYTLMVKEANEHRNLDDGSSPNYQ